MRILLIDDGDKNLPTLKKMADNMGAEIDHFHTLSEATSTSHDYDLAILNLHHRPLPVEDSALGSASELISALKTAWQSLDSSTASMPTCYAHPCCRN